MGAFKGLRARLAELPTDKSRRFSPELWAELDGAVAGLRASGMGMNRIAMTLRVSMSTLYRLPSVRAPKATTAKAAGGRPQDGEGRRLVPVGVTMQPATLVVVAPSGLRVEGLDVDAAIKVARALS